MRIINTITGGRVNEQPPKYIKCSISVDHISVNAKQRKPGGYMLTLRENALAILHGKQPDKYDDFMNAMQFLLDPIWLSDRTPQDGEFHKDSWGVTKCFLPGAPGAHPHITPDNKVCKNI